MGLDITAYAKVERIGDTDYDSEEADTRNLYVEPGREDRGAPLTTGLYRTSGDTKDFRAGGYIGYNVWRAWLSRTMLGVEPATVWHTPEAYNDKPFFELIHFADNEGTIGPVVSAKLAADFAAHRQKAVADTADDGEDGAWNLLKYDIWAAAFALAANTGAVVFH